MTAVASVPGNRRILDRRSPLPLWAQVLADLRARVAAGGFTDRFPPMRSSVGSTG